VNVACLVLMKCHKAPKQSLLQDFRWIVLTHSSKRFEKQIKDIQDKAETVKMEVCFVLSTTRAHRMLIHCPDHPDTISCSTVATSRSSRIKL
jgi:hypothetical protein